jgi:hypothetical protein
LESNNSSLSEVRRDDDDGMKSDSGEESDMKGRSRSLLIEEKLELLLLESAETDTDGAEARLRDGKRSSSVYELRPL